MSFLIPTSEEQNKKRAGDIKEIAQKLGSNYFSETNSYINSFQDEKENYLIKEERKYGNYIVGKIDGHHYCLLEYYHRPSGRNYEFDCFISQAIIKMKNNYYPSFHLMTKKSVIFVMKKNILILLAISLSYLYFIIYSEIRVYLLAGYLGFILICVILIATIEEGRISISKQEHYNINPEFKEKYIIKTDCKPNEIDKIFTEEICSKIKNVNIDLDIEMRNNCIVEDYKRGDQLSLESCKKHLDSLLFKAKLFESEK